MHRLCLLRLLLCFMLALADCLTGPPSRADAPVGKRYRTTIPYTPSQHGFIYVQVRMDSGLPGGGLTGTFLLDTGTSTTCITDALAAKLGLSPVPAVGVDGKPIFFQPGRQGQMVNVPLLQMSNFRLLRQSCLVLSQKSLSALAGQPVDGILGATVLAVYPMYFDFVKHQITLFYPSPLTRDELRSVGMDDALVLPVADITGGGFQFACPVVLVSGADRVQSNLVVDTGASGTIISERIARQIQLQPVSDDRNSPTLFGNIAVRQAYLPTLSLGSLGVNNLLIRYTQSLSASFPAHVGLDVLSKFRMLLDYKQMKMYLKPITATALPMLQTVPASGGEKSRP